MRVVGERERVRERERVGVRMGRWGVYINVGVWVWGKGGCLSWGDVRSVGLVESGVCYAEF